MPSTQRGFTTSGWVSPRPAPAPYRAPALPGVAIDSVKPFAIVTIVHCDDKDYVGREAVINPSADGKSNRTVSYLTNTSSYNGRIGRVMWNSVKTLKRLNTRVLPVRAGKTYTLTAA